MKRAPPPAAAAIPIAAVLLYLLSGSAAGWSQCPSQAHEAVLSWVSSAREAAGLPVLEVDPILRRAAVRYAAELASRGVLSHRDAQGGSALDRVRAAGGTSTLVGEILGSGPGAAEVCAAWATSGAHRAVVEGTRWTHVGTGCATRGTRQVWVVLFAARRVQDLRIQVEAPEGFRVSGRLPAPIGRRPFLMSGLEPVEPALWRPDTGEFVYHLGPGTGQLYHRLGFVDADGTVAVTDAFYPARVATSSPETVPR
jgi:uncharacterized protein YkwD